MTPESRQEISHSTERAPTNYLTHFSCFCTRIASSTRNAPLSFFWRFLVQIISQNRWRFSRATCTKIASTNSLTHFSCNLHQNRANKFLDAFFVQLAPKTRQKKFLDAILVQLSPKSRQQIPWRISCANFTGIAPTKKLPKKNNTIFRQTKRKTVQNV